MAVLVEAISVIVRRDAIEKRYSGGWRSFLNAVPNKTLCFDEDLVRVGFMSPADAETFVRSLEKDGLTFIRNRQAIDIVVVDQMRGPTIQSGWLEFSHLAPEGTENKVAVCWLIKGERTASGVQLPSREMQLATPEGWHYEESLSANFNLVTDGDMGKKLKFLRRESGQDVYLDLATGREVFIGRT